jgi:hypothetical protein
MAASGEAVVVDGLATRVQRPRGWANQKVLYDAKRHAHTAQGLAVSTIHGDLLWADGGSCSARADGVAVVLSFVCNRATAERVAAAVETAATVPWLRTMARSGRRLSGPGIGCHQNFV